MTSDADLICALPEGFSPPIATWTAEQWLAVREARRKHGALLGETEVAAVLGSAGTDGGDDRDRAA